MKKFLGTALAMLAVTSFVVAGSTAYACGDDAKADKTSSTSTCCKDKATTATAQTVSAKGATCSPDHPEACGTAQTASAKMADCGKECPYAGKCQFRTISVKGMTCGGCEQSVQTALVGTPGVLKVVSVSYKTGTAVVCVDPTKCQDKALSTAITSKGFEATVIPAVATTTTPANATDAKACTASKTAGADCCAKKAADTKETASKDNTSKEPL